MANSQVKMAGSTKEISTKPNQSIPVMAAFAQEESRTTSENLKWGIRKRFEKGISRWTPTYGYRLNEAGVIVLEIAVCPVGGTPKISIMAWL